jgi:hypothetical protein
MLKWRRILEAEIVTRIRRRRQRNLQGQNTFLFSTASRPALGPIQPPIHRVQEAISWPVTWIKCRGQKWVVLYLHSYIYLYDVHTGTTLRVWRRVYWLMRLGRMCGWVSSFFIIVDGYLHIWGIKDSSVDLDKIRPIVLQIIISVVNYRVLHTLHC